MVKLRLRRMGRKQAPIYDIVAADSRTPRDGRFIEKIGQYNPLIKGNPVTILKRDRVLHWLNNGAQPTDTVRNLLRREGVILERYLTRKGVDRTAVAQAIEAHVESKRSIDEKAAREARAAADAKARAEAEAVAAAEAAEAAAKAEEEARAQAEEEARVKAEADAAAAAEAAAQAEAAPAAEETPAAEEAPASEAPTNEENV